MIDTWAVLAYGSAAFLALFLLYYSEPKAWYWHALSVAAALTIGLVPWNIEGNDPLVDLGLGWIFTFLFLWGICAPLFHGHHPHHHHHHPRHV